MGTTGRVRTLGGSPALAQDGVRRVADLERRWTRFRDDSELSRLHQAAGRPTIVSPETYALVEHAVVGWEATAGRFDPTVHDAMVANGYDRPFTEIAADITRGRRVLAQATPGLGGVLLDPALCAVTVPHGVRLDPGGIGKGLAADIVAAELLGAGATGVLVDIGGDIRVAGTGPHDGGWVIDVAHPSDVERTVLHVVVHDAGIATSSVLRRRWVSAGAVRHHLLDPRDGLPVRGRIVAATVIAATATVAEVETKAVIVAGTHAGARAGTSVIVTYADGSTESTPELQELML